MGMSGALTTIQYILDPRLKLLVIKNAKKRLEGTANQARVLNLLRMGKFEIKKMDGGKIIASYDAENDVKKSVKFNLTNNDCTAIRSAIKQCRQMFNTTNKSDAFAYNENIRDNDYTGKKHENSIRTNFYTIPIEKFHAQCAENLSEMTSPQDVYDFFELYTEFEHTKLDKKYEHIFVHRDTLFKFIQEFIPEAGVSQVDNMPGEEAYAKMCKIIQDWVWRETGMISSGLNEIMENFQTFMSMGIKGLLRLDIIKNRHTKTISRLREAHAEERQHIANVIHEEELRNLNEKVRMQNELQGYQRAFQDQQEKIQNLEFLKKASFDTNQKLQEEYQKIQQDLRKEQSLVKTLEDKCQSEKDKYEEMLTKQEAAHKEIREWYNENMKELENEVSEKEKELEKQKANNEKLGQKISEKESKLAENDKQIKLISEQNASLDKSLKQAHTEIDVLFKQNETERQQNKDKLKTQNEEYSASREKLQKQIAELKEQQISAQAELELSQKELSETKEKLEQNANEKEDIEPENIFASTN